MTDGGLLRKLTGERIAELYGGQREKAQNLKNRGFLKREANYWRVTEAGRAYIRTH